MLTWALAGAYTPRSMQATTIAERIFRPAFAKEESDRRHRLTDRLRNVPCATVRTRGVVSVAAVCRYLIGASLGGGLVTRMLDWAMTRGAGRFPAVPRGGQRSRDEERNPAAEAGQVYRRRRPARMYATAQKSFSFHGSVLAILILRTAEFGWSSGKDSTTMPAPEHGRHRTDPRGPLQPHGATSNPCLSVK
jgi:hypothetical protein